MKVLVVSCHPDPESFTGHIRARALAALSTRHHVRHVDLYAGPETSDDVAWADALVVIYPTWWSGPPAAMVEWIDKTWSRRGRYPQLRTIAVVTTHGSTWWVNQIEGEVGRRVFLRGLRRRAHPRCRRRWIAMYDVDRSTPQERRAFVERVERELSRLR